MSYLQVLRAEPRFLAFGFVMAFGSSFGQTFLVSLFSAELRADYGLSHGGFGTVYSLGTLTSAAVMIWAGQMIDRIDLRHYAGIVAAGMALACLVIAGAPAESAVYLFIAIFLLRFSGQGLMSHTSVTAMARYFEVGRGKALSIAGLGYTTGEALLPTLTVSLILWLGWRETYGLYGLVVLCGLLPLALWLLRGHEGRHRSFLQRLEESDRDPAAARHWTRREVLRHPFFYLVLPLILAQSFIITGFFFHQVHLAETKGWPLQVYATTFFAFASATVLSGLTMGPLIDRFGARRLLPFVKLPLAAGLLVLATGNALGTAYLYMALAGITSGAFATLSGAFWAEVYGLRHLGSIRALTTSLMVLSSAGSPVAMGLMIDAGIGLETIALLSAGHILLAIGLALLARRFHATGEEARGATALTPRG